MQGNRVVITGLGSISPLGNSAKTSWDAALNGQSGIGTIDRFDVEALPVKFAGLVKGFDPTTASPGKLARQSSLFILYAADAAKQAMEDAQLSLSEKQSLRSGVAFGSGIGGLQWIENNHTKLIEQGAKRVSPFFIPGSIINLAAGRVSIAHQLKGPNVAAVSACATGIHNIGLAARMIAYGEADVMLAGGSEAVDSPLNIAGFSALRALSTRNDNPQAASRPFDQTRDGFVLAEGACALVLESLDHARARGAQIYSEIKGFGMSADAYHITGVSGEGGVRSMSAALTDANLNPTDIGHINAHATSTLLGDGLELEAVQSVFGNHTANIAISGTKSMTGHLLGATGALECMYSIQALRDQTVPPTINLENPIGDKSFNLVPNTSQQHAFHAVLCNSFGFGGANASIIFTAL